MTTFPLPLTQLVGQWGTYAIFLLIGFSFGFVLEIAGFGNSRKLAAQFYFKDMTVLKVMFSAIVVAMVLIFWASGVGLLDYNLIWVNPTYLWPGIVGGLIMGFGFIIGGFCPGTSLVAAATAKIDGIFFALGVFFGIFVFGETVGSFDSFWNSSYMGRYTLMNWLNLPTGVVVLLVVLMALFMFWGGEQLERIFGEADPRRAPRWRYGAGGALLLAAVGLLLVGQPDNEDRWGFIADEKEVLLAERQVQIHPGELLEISHDRTLQVIKLDVRSETDYNLFHLLDARHTPLDTLLSRVPELHLEPANTVFVVMSNGEEQATEAWKMLVAASVPNVYILEGGINNWLDTFASTEFKAEHALLTPQEGKLRYMFTSALGSGYAIAEPDPHQFELSYTSKVKLELKRAPTGGGCG